MWWVVWSSNPFMNELTKQNMQRKSQQKTFALSLSHANIVTIDSCNFDPCWLLIIIFWCCHLTSFNEENIETSRNVIIFFFFDTKKSCFFRNQCDYRNHVHSKIDENLINKQKNCKSRNHCHTSPTPWKQTKLCIIK